MESSSETARSKPPIRRRNSIYYLNLSDNKPNTSDYCSISTSISSQSLPAVDFKFIPTKSVLGYTSLKDILPSIAVQSPTTAPSPRDISAYDISIRNPLVKQAAWAYLQPMSAADGSGGRHFLHLLRDRVFGCLRSMASILRQTISHILRSIRLRG